MPSKKRTDTPTASTGKCALCWKPAGHDAVMFHSKRHQHFLTFSHGKELEAHLLEQYGEERVKDGMIRSIMAWYYGKKDEEWAAAREAMLEKRPQFDSDAREPKDGPEPVWGDDR